MTPVGLALEEYIQFYFLFLCSYPFASSSSFKMSSALYLFTIYTPSSCIPVIHVLLVSVYSQAFCMNYVFESFCHF